MSKVKDGRAVTARCASTYVSVATIPHDVGGRVLPRNGEVHRGAVCGAVYDDVDTEHAPWSNVGD